MHFFTHCVLACVLLYPIQSFFFKNYIQLCLNMCIYLCHVFNNTKIKGIFKLLLHIMQQDTRGLVRIPNFNAKVKSTKPLQWE